MGRRQSLNEVRELVQWVQQNQSLPAVDSHLFLKSGENAFYSAACNLWETRSVRSHQSGMAGFRVAKGIYIGGSKGKSVSNQEIAKIDEGVLVVTNKRLVFDGSTADRTVMLNKVLSLNKDSTSIEVSVEGRQKSLYFEVNNSYVLDFVTRICIAAEDPKDLTKGDVEITIDPRYAKPPSKSKPPPLPSKLGRYKNLAIGLIISVVILTFANLFYGGGRSDAKEERLSASKDSEPDMSQKAQADTSAQGTSKTYKVSLIDVSDPLWLNADEYDAMKVKFSLTNNHNFPVSSVAVMFKFYDITGKELAAGKVKSFSDTFDAGEVKEFDQFNLGEYPKDTIKVVGEVVSVSN